MKTNPSMPVESSTANKLLDPLHSALAAWFAGVRRDFPWRRNRTPYRVWIAEIMLQQTRADQALPYYQRFMRQFPGLKALAAAGQQDVLKAWEGLGYYGRARKLHQTAQTIARDLGGRFPRTYDALLALPGIGPYSAAAIASIAFGEPRAVVDGNVVRVLSRLFLLDTPFDTPAGRRLFQEQADRLLDRAAPGAHNEAMMELGATCCLPRKPLCSACPLSPFCGALRERVQHDYPQQSPKKKIPHIHVGAGVIVDRRNRVLIAQRREADMLGGLWESPGGKREPGETNEECIRRELLEEMGIHVRVGPHLITVHHAYSHFRMDLHAYWVRIERGRPRAIECAAVRWVPLDRLDDFPMSRADDRIRQCVKTTPPPDF